MWFFTNAKLVLGSISALVVGIFFAIFKARGKEITEQAKEIQDLEDEAHLAELLKDVSEETDKEYKATLEVIDESYEEGIERAYSDPTVDLSPSLLELLRNTQGIPDKDTKPSE